jgi:hypothetical protein
MQNEKSLIRRPAIFSPFSWLTAGESTRHGGVSLPPFASLNLGKSTGDDPDHLVENKRRFCEAAGMPPDRLAWAKQVHGDQIWLATAPGGVEGFDALMTQTPGLLLVVSIADCTPILIADPVHRAVAAIHAGWRGTAAGIVSKTLAGMHRHFGTTGSDCLAYVGTCIDECSFEVGHEVADQFDDSLKRLDPVSGKYFVDLKQANARQLEAFGIPSGQIEISPWSTVLHNEDYFSHRLEKGTTGRMLGFIGIR